MTVTSTPWAKISPIEPHDNVDSFSCGLESVDSWFKLKAIESQRDGRVRTWVCKDANSNIIAFFALKTITIRLAAKEGSALRSLGDESTAVLIAQMGITGNYQGNGYATHLVSEILAKCVAVDSISSTRAVAVDAENDSLIPFYEKNGFVHTRSQRGRLLMKMSRARKMVEAAQEVRQQNIS